MLSACTFTQIVEVPEVKVVDKIVELPRVEYQYKYVQKIETQENIIQRPKYETKYVEKIVEVPQVKEVVRYQDVEEVEEVIRWAPENREELKHAALSSVSARKAHEIHCPLAFADYELDRYVPKGQVASEEWERLKEKHEQEVKMEREAREAQYKAEQEYQQLIAEEQAAYEAKRMGMPSTGPPPMPPVSSHKNLGQINRAVTLPFQSCSSGCLEWRRIIYFWCCALYCACRLPV